MDHVPRIHIGVLSPVINCLANKSIYFPSKIGGYPVRRINKRLGLTKKNSLIWSVSYAKALKIFTFWVKFTVLLNIGGQQILKCFTECFTFSYVINAKNNRIVFECFDANFLYKMDFSISKHQTIDFWS